MDMLNNKVAVVFAASGAIGGSVAQAFAQAGAKVYVTGKDTEVVNKLADEIILNGGWAAALRADALSETDIDAVFEKVVADGGHCL